MIPLAWDDIKYDNLTDLPANEWNDHVTDQKSRAKVLSGSGAPVSTPSMVGAIYVDTNNEEFYIAKGTSGSTDWIKLTEYEAFDTLSTDFNNHSSDTSIHFTIYDVLYTMQTTYPVTVGSLKSNKGIYYDEEVTATSSINWQNGNKQSLTLTADTTLTFTDPAGPCNLVLKIVQDSTGGWNVTFPSNVKFENGVTVDLSSDPGNSVRIVSLYFDGTDYYAQISDYYA